MATQQSEVDLPEHARERLHAMREGAGGRRFFTSDLTVSEFLLVKEAGFEPLGLVVGTSIYHIGFQFARIRQNMEMDVLTQAMYHARELAMQRMGREAMALGAEGVVGANINERTHGWNSHVIEFLAVGTAIVATSDAHQIATPQLTISLSADRHPPSVVQNRPTSQQPQAGGDASAAVS